MKTRARGFTLIEVIVSIFIVGLMLLGLVATAQNLPLARFAKNQDLALKIAHTELETLRAGGYDALPTSGSFASSQLSSLPEGAGSVTVSSFGTDIDEVDVVVSWQQENFTSSSTVSLSTLVTKTGGL